MILSHEESPDPGSWNHVVPDAEPTASVMISHMEDWFISAGKVSYIRPHFRHRTLFSGRYEYFGSTSLLAMTYSTSAGGRFLRQLDRHLETLGMGP